MGRWGQTRLRMVWLGGMCLLAALLWVGCTSTAAREPITPTQAAASPTSEATASSTPQPSPTTVPASPTPEDTPTAVPKEATPPASAEGPSRSSSERPSVVPTADNTQPANIKPFQPANGRARVVAIDPGHGGAEVGAAGAGLAEKDVNLSIALKLRTMLEQDGMRVVLTRDKDTRAYVPPVDKTPEGNSVARLDLQTRIDVANNAQADVFLSVHNNGSTDTAQSGTEVWYDGKRPFAAFNKALADDLLSSIVGAIRATGYATADRGLKEDSQFRTYRGYNFPIFVLGPPRTGTTNTRATRMPAALGETLFLSNPVEAAQLKRDAVLTAIAQGYRDGLKRYFQSIDGGSLVLPPGGLPAELPNHYDLAPPSSSTDGH